MCPSLVGTRTASLRTILALAPLLSQTVRVTTTLRIGDLRLTRVLYVDAAIDPSATGLSPDEVRGVAWGEPLWAEGDKVKVAACTWVIDGRGRTIVVDPMGNADEILHDPASTAAHQNAVGSAFRAAGIDPDAVDTVLLSHIESMGMIAVREAGIDAGWRPFFTNSRILMSEPARESFPEQMTSDLVREGFTSLFESGLVDTFRDDDRIVDGLRAEWTGAHNPGHAAFHVGVPPELTFVGHLAVSPLHLATGPCRQQHPEPGRAWEILHSVAADGRVLVGPLWPSPGAGRWINGTFVAFDR